METTALGATYLAGLQLGLYKNLADIVSYKQIEQRFTQSIDKNVREKLLKQWQKAVESTLAFSRD